MTEDGKDCDSAAGEAADRSGRAAGEAADRSRAQFFRPFAGSPLERRNPHVVRATAAIVWLAFIVFPLANAFGKKGTELEEFLVIAGAAVFVGLYVYLVLHWRGQPRTPIPLLVFALMLAISAALTIFQGSGWGFLFTYCAACAALVPAAGFAGVAACTVLAGVCSALGGANGGTVVGFVASSAGVGLLMLVMRDLRVRNVELNEARAELADLAVAKERERFARDLHDLIGHSLSVIALKAELAGRMLADGPHDAANEVAEVEQVARTALREVREAVSGYHQPTLDGELAGARMALSAAGIEADVEEARVRLDPAVEAVLAWTVREGATNVIRHSGAHHCMFRVTATLSDAGVEVIDDGQGVNGNGAGWAGAATDGDSDPSRAGVPSPRVARNGAGNAGGPRATGGHGIAGLAERARTLNGTVVAGALDGGGFRLAVTVPVPVRRT